MDLDPHSSLADDEDKSSEISLVRAPVGPFHWTTRWVLDLDPYSSVVRAPVGFLKRKLLIPNLNGLLAHIFDIGDLDSTYILELTFRRYACEK